MTALEDARAAERGLTITIDFAVRMGGCPTREMYAARDALRALIAEYDALDRALYEVESKHHFHGVQCLCGFESHRSRSRTEHITAEVRNALEAAREADR